MTDRDRLAARIEDEQRFLWSQLRKDIDRALNGSWSMAAANTALRIVSAAHLVGPTHPHELDWDLVQGEVYQAVLTAGGVPLHPILDDVSEMARTDEMMKGCDRAQNVARYMATVRVIQSPRETAYIKDGGE
jgi:hypothetical protein